MTAVDPTSDAAAATPLDAAEPVASRFSAITAHWQGFWAAVQFLTRIPVPAACLADTSDDRPRLRLATIYFPLVGSLVGLTTGMLIWAAAHFWPIWLAVVAGLVVEAFLTAALHEDALADCCDAFGGGWTKADVLRILDDSRLGTYGVLGLTLAVLMRVAALASFEPDMLLPAVLASATLGRWAMILAMAALPPVPERPSLSRQAGRQTVGHVAAGALLAMPGTLPLTLVSPLRLGVSVVIVTALTVLFVAYLWRRIGGMTGDGVGAVCYLSQVAVLLCCAVRH